MSGQSAVPERGASPLPLDDWVETLDELERDLRSAVRALERLRAGLRAGDQPHLQVIAPKEPEGPEEVETGRSLLGGTNGGAYTPFERLWERLEQERIEKQQPPEEAVRRGLDLLPRQYVMTVEERERSVDLISLHRALQGLAGVQEITLISFANGVPVVSLRTDRDLDVDRLRDSASAAMDRACEVIVQDNGRIHLRLKPDTDREE